MIRLFLRIISMIILLSGCVYHSGSAVSAQEKRACKIACQQRMDQCQSTCVDACKPCAQQVNQEALLRYKNYYHERCVQGKTIIRQLQSYRDPLQCRKTSCDCPADYRVCVESCTGEIHKRLQVTPTCC